MSVPKAVFPNTLGDFFGRELSMDMSFSLTLNTLGLLFFSGELILITLFTVSMSVHSNLRPSPLLMAVSLSS